MKQKQDFFSHSQALVEGEVGSGSRIWAWAHVMKGAKVGKDCNIGEHCFIEKGAVIGDRVVIKNGTSVWEGVTVENDAFLGPNMIFTNESYPRHGFPKDLEKTIIKKGASIGAGAIILCGITIGQYATVGAGAVVTRDVADHALVYGNPASRKGWVCVCGLKLPEGDSVVCKCGRRYEKRPSLIK
ncbi:N-acetyltransferase [Candidatus Poribacteria bacterium]|nr:N-acetyltransferase [Candidatus Poribacteria bacterium]